MHYSDTKHLMLVCFLKEKNTITDNHNQCFILSNNLNSQFTFLQIGNKIIIFLFSVGLLTRTHSHIYCMV